MSLPWLEREVFRMARNERISELVYQQHYRTREEARLAIFEYIESFYNRTRLHSTLDYRSPEEYERSVA